MSGAETMGNEQTCWREFLGWVDQLEAIMRAWHEKHGNLPYELPLDRDPENGNLLCWKDSYDDGMTPQEAFEVDQTYWEE